MLCRRSQQQAALQVACGGFAWLYQSCFYQGASFDVNCVMPPVMLHCNALACLNYCIGLLVLACLACFHLCSAPSYCYFGLLVAILNYFNTVALACLKQCLLSRDSHWPVALASFYVLFTLYCCIGLLQTGSGCSAGVLTYSLIPPPLLGI